MSGFDPTPLLAVVDAADRALVQRFGCLLPAPAPTRYIAEVAREWFDRMHREHAQQTAERLVDRICEARLAALLEDQRRRAAHREAHAARARQRLEQAPRWKQRLRARQDALRAYANQRAKV